MTDRTTSARPSASKARRTLQISAVTILVVGCAAVVNELAEEHGGSMITTAGINRSMIYAVDSGEGMVLVDLGWWGADDKLRARLARIGRDSSDVVAVFLTHAHRDHIAGWSSVPNATFYIAEPELDELYGEAEYEGWIPRFANRLHPTPRPARGDIAVVVFSADTTVVVGQDTVRAFLVPGHTEGSAAYLIRRVLFAGDALAPELFGGFQPARPGYSDDTELATRSLALLFERAAPFGVDTVCTAHARCSAFTDEFRSEALTR